MRVIALDPGKLFGWAAADIDADGTWSNLEHGILPAKDMILDLADDVIARAPYGVIVYEDWVLYRDHVEEYIGSDMPYSQMIGQIRLIGWLSDTPVVKQAAARKNFARRQLGAFRPVEAALVERIEQRAHKDAHDGDAILHLFGYTVDNFPVVKHAT